MRSFENDVNKSFSVNKNEAHHIISTSDPNISSSLRVINQNSFQNTKEQEKKKKEIKAKETPLIQKIWSYCTL